MLYIARKTGRNEGTEVIVHRVTSKWDKGELVAMRNVPIEDVNEESKVLQERAKLVEHQLQIDFLNEYARGIVLELVSLTQYIRPGEEHILFEARRYARGKDKNEK